MGSPLQHRKKSESNQAFIDEILSLPFPDWTATAIFYKAVHVVEMMFGADGIHSENHADSNQRLKSNYPDVFAEFHPLYNFAFSARYDCREVRKSELPYLFQRLDTMEDIMEKRIAGKA